MNHQAGAGDDACQVSWFFHEAIEKDKTKKPRTWRGFLDCRIRLT
jgi:hypothetical protein